VYIHASNKLDRAALDWLRDQAHVTPPSKFVHGAVVAVADIVDAVTKPNATTFAPWFFGPYGFVSLKSGGFRRECRKRADSA
jgi:hypothetical protein